MGCSFTLVAQNVEVKISNIQSNQGQIIIGVFKDKNSFEKENPFMIKIFEKTGMLNGELTVSFTLEPGIYGICVHDDKNNDNKMNYNFLGIPLEGFGFSNFYFSGIFKPSFNTFKFTLEKGQTLKIISKLRYI